MNLIKINSINTATDQSKIEKSLTASLFQACVKLTKLTIILSVSMSEYTEMISVKGTWNEVYKCLS